VTRPAASRARLARRSAPPPETPPDLRQSLESTLRGLRALLHSLEGSGFKDAAGPYREMQVVLLQQRLWSRNHGRTDLDPLWSELAATARAVEAILADFGAVMADLADLDRIEPGAADSVGRPADEALELALLLSDGSFSGASLRRGLPWPVEVRRRRLAALVRGGVLERRGWGRSLSYRLTEGARGRLADELSRVITSGGVPAEP
jgi:hypothetical protein